MKTNNAARFTWIWCLFISASIVSGLNAPSAFASDDRIWPVDGPVIRTFQKPPKPWLSGHRGIDIAAPAGTTVVAAAAGTITWVGVIAGVPSVSVTHSDGLRTTYLPVTAGVTRGQRVAAGEAIGVLEPGHAANDCLHLGLLRGQEYLDPLPWLGGVRNGPVRLLPVNTAITASGAKVGTSSP